MTKLLSSILVLSALLHTDAVLASRPASGDGSAPEASASRRLGGVTSLYDIKSDLPQAADRNYDLINAGFDTGIDVSCAGIDLQNVLQAHYNIDFNNMMDYLQSNAMNMAINYMIYENPTLYSLLQDLKVSGDWALNQQAVSCQSLRQVADKKRRNSDYYAEAKAACLADGNTETQCTDDGKLEQYLSIAIKDRERRMNSGISSTGTTSTGGVQVGSGNGGSGSAPTGGRSTSWVQFVTSNLSLSDSDKSLLSRHTGDVVVGSDGSVTNIPPKASISQDLDDIQKSQFARLTTVFDAPLSDRSAFDPTRNSAALQELRRLNLEEGAAPITLETITRVNAYPATDRKTAIARLARLRSLGIVKAQMRREIMINLAGLKGPNAAKEAYPEERRWVRESINDLRFQMDLLDSEIETLQIQQNAMNSLIDNAPATKPIIR